MTLKTRLNKIEGMSGTPAAHAPNCIYLCALTKCDGEPDPQVALLIGGDFQDQVSRLPDETLEEFVSRVEAITASQKDLNE